MRNPSPTLALALVGLLAAGTAFAQAPPPAPGAAPAAVAPPPPGAAPDAAALAPPPPPPPGAAPPPPPPPGAHLILERGANGFVHVDVHCVERDTTQDCAGLAERMLEKVAGR